MTPPTIAEIAQRLGLSKFTVSVALRNKPGVSAAVRERVLAEAKAMGYAPDVIANEMMSIIRSRRRSTGGQTVAFINTFRDASMVNHHAAYQAFLRGAQERARMYGYRVEEFSIHAKGMTAPRLTQILKARGIRGVLIGPRWVDDPEVEFGWDPLRCVVVGETEYAGVRYRICNHHTHTCSLTLRKMVELGYRRIGLAAHKPFEAARGFEFLLGLDEMRRQVGRKVFFATYQPSGSLQWNEELLFRWIREKRLDAVVSLFFHPLLHMRAAGNRGPADWGFACMDLEGVPNCAGVNQDSTEIGRAAFDLLLTLLRAGDRDRLLTPRTVLLEGTWQDGPTAPRVPGPS